MPASERTICRRCRRVFKMPVRLKCAVRAAHVPRFPRCPSCEAAARRHSLMVAKAYFELADKRTFARRLDDAHRMS